MLKEVIIVLLSISVLIFWCRASKDDYKYFSVKVSDIVIINVISIILATVIKVSIYSIITACTCTFAIALVGFIDSKYQGSEYPLADVLLMFPLILLAGFIGIIGILFSIGVYIPVAILNKRPIEQIPIVTVYGVAFVISMIVTNLVKY